MFYICQNTLAMGILDITLGLLLIWGLYKGFKNGLFLELASLVALVAGIYGAIHFSYITGEYLSQTMNWDEKYINLTAFLITFIAIIIAVQLAGKFLTKIADFAMLGIINKIAGAIFGTLKVVIIISALLVFFGRVNANINLVSNEVLENSILYSPIKEIGSFIFDAVLKSDNLDSIENS